MIPTVRDWKCCATSARTGVSCRAFVQHRSPCGRRAVRHRHARDALRRLRNVDRRFAFMRPADAVDPLNPLSRRDPRSLRTRGGGHVGSTFSPLGQIPKYGVLAGEWRRRSGFDSTNRPAEGKAPLTPKQRPLPRPKPRRSQCDAAPLSRHGAMPDSAAARRRIINRGAASGPTSWTRRRSIQVCWSRRRCAAGRHRKKIRSLHRHSCRRFHRYDRQSRSAAATTPIRRVAVREAVLV